MKKKYLMLFVILVVSLGMISAAYPRERVGDRFYIPPDGDGGYLQDYPANQAFHFAHGWRAFLEPKALKDQLGRGGTRLFLDEVEITPDFIEYVKEEVINEDTGLLAGCITKYYVFNFPGGLEGYHHIQFYYSYTCEDLLELGLVDICEKPHKVIEALYKDWYVNFVAP